MKLPIHFSLLLTLAAGAAQADTLVNIKGYGADGAGANIFAYPVPPGTVFSGFNPVLVALAAGDYDIVDAWGQPGALYDAWNFEVGAVGSWSSAYVAAEPLGGDLYRVLLVGEGLEDPSCANHFCAWSTQQEAAAAFLATPPSRLHLDQAMTVAFMAADYYLLDNLGGMSISVSAVPEPQAWLTGLVGLLGVAWRRRGGEHARTGT